MIKNFFTFLGVFLSAAVFGQSNYWTATSNMTVKTLKERKSQPANFKLFNLNLDGLKSALVNAPARFSADESLVLKFPDANGKLLDYVVQDAAIMAPELQAKFPEIRSYIGWEKGNKSNSIRISVSPFEGVNAMYINGAEVSYMDTYTKDNGTYVVYKRGDLVKEGSTFNCGYDDLSMGAKFDKVEEPQPIVVDGKMRKFRLALSCTIEYAAFHVNAAELSGGTLAQKKAAVMAAYVATMTRVNGVFETNVSLTMQLVADTDKIIFIDSDEFDNQNSAPAYPLMSQNQTVCDTVIGTANYDIGHVFSTASGGVARLQSPCNGSFKAYGTTGTSSPFNDPFDIDYVAHEMGHQYGATHTFNNSCNDNVSTLTAVEPGSGSTIMGYAGICSPNVQFNSDPYFHAVSVSQMYNFIATGTGTCSQQTSNGNSAPVLAALPIRYNIPLGTAFALTASAVDPDGDALTYLWEQTDTQMATMPPVQTSATGPLFRSLLPVAVGTRVFPPMANVWTNNLRPTYQVIPNVARNINFSVLVNDNKVTGNQTARLTTRVVVAATGPFVVTSQNTSGVAYDAAVPLVVTWNVAGTSAAPINTAFVKITMSTGGNADAPFDVVLAESVPNTGSATVMFPNEDVASGRIKIEAVDNIYFALSKNTFKVNKNLAVNDVTKKSFSIYPNPAKGEVNVLLSNKSTNADYMIYDQSGRLLQSGKLPTTSKVNISKLSAGVYRLVVANDGDVTSQNLVIK